MTLARILETMVAWRGLLRWVVLTVMALLVLVDWIVPPAYSRFPWDGIGGFAAFYGLVSCVLIIVVSKALGYALLYRKENYYEGGQGGGDD